MNKQNKRRAGPFSSYHGSQGYLVPIVNYIKTYLASTLTPYGRHLTPPRNIFKIKLGKKMQWLWFMDMTKAYVIREKFKL